VLHSSDEGRAVLIGLLPGQKLGDHQVKEHAFLVVVDGSAQIEAAGETLDAVAGTMVAFDPDERRIVASDSGGKMLLMLAPWPGAGHYTGHAGPRSGPHGPLRSRRAAHRGERLRGQDPPHACAVARRGPLPRRSGPLALALRGPLVRGVEGGVHPVAEREEHEQEERRPEDARRPRLAALE